MLGRSYALRWYVSECAATVAARPVGEIIVEAMLAMAVVVSGNRHILGPSISRRPHMMGVPSESLIVTSDFVKVTEQSASQNTPILRRLLANDGMIVQSVVPGGKLGRLMDAVADDCSSWPLAILIVVGAAL
jgi:hypothetical protein